MFQYTTINNEKGFLMIGFLAGEIKERSGNRLVLFNTETKVGWEVFVPVSNNESFFIENNECELFIKTIVRENDISLYGFLTREEKHIFEKLLMVSGIGAKTAIEVLNHVSPESLANSIIAKDTKSLSDRKSTRLNSSH